MPTVREDLKLSARIHRIWGRKANGVDIAITVMALMETESLNDIPSGWKDRDTVLRASNGYLNKQNIGWNDERPDGCIGYEVFIKSKDPNKLTYDWNIEYYLLELI